MVWVTDRIGDGVSRVKANAGGAWEENSSIFFLNPVKFKVKGSQAGEVKEREGDAEIQDWNLINGDKSELEWDKGQRQGLLAEEEADRLLELKISPKLRAWYKTVSDYALKDS